MSGTTIERADRAVADAAAPAHKSGLTTVLGTLSEVADQPQLITLCTVTLAVGLAGRDARLARTGGRMLAAELVATWIKSAIKHRVDRTRPRAAAGGHAHMLRRGASRDSDLNSFPSGHTSGAVAVARAIARDHPGHRFAAYAAAAAIAVVQIPRGKHYVSDLLAGAVIGVAAEAAVHAGEKAVMHMVLEA